MLIVTHIAKTGGTSFLTYLQQVYGRRLYHDLSFTQPGKPTWSRRLIWKWFGNKWWVPRGTACIFGHFRSTKYDRDYPDARHAAWFRDPVERVISAYHFIRRLHRPEDAFCKRVQQENLSLEQFVGLPEMQNQQTRILRGKPVAAFDFVGITEQYAASMQLFARIFDLPVPAELPRANANPERSGQQYAVNNDLREYIRQLNLLDEATCRQSNQRFADLAQTHDVSLGAAPSREEHAA